MYSFLSFKNLNCSISYQISAWAANDLTYNIEMFTKAVHMYLEANSWPSFLSRWIISSLLGFRARIKKVGGANCIGFESSTLSYLDRVVISSRQSRTKSREESEPYTQKQPKRIEKRIQLHKKSKINKLMSIFHVSVLLLSMNFAITLSK